MNQLKPFLFAGRYECVKCLGGGVYSTVYLAKDRAKGGLEVTVKVFCDRSASIEGHTPTARKARLQFAQEAELLFLLHSPHIVKAYYTSTAQGNVPYIVMEYIEGETLLMRMRRGPVSYLHAFQWTKMLLDGLAVAHRDGILHRDLSPRNLMLEEVCGKHVLKIIDFGIARSEATLSNEDELQMGTPLYCSPEQLRGESLSLASDVYSVGLLLHEWLLGVVPHTDKDGATIMYHRAFEHIPSPNADGQALPDDLEAFLMKALAQDPACRYRSSIEMKEAFSALYDRYVSVDEDADPGEDTFFDEELLSSIEEQWKQEEWEQHNAAALDLFESEKAAAFSHTSGVGWAGRFWGALVSWCMSKVVTA